MRALIQSASMPLYCDENIIRVCMIINPRPEQGFDNGVRGVRVDMYVS